MNHESPLGTLVHRTAFVSKYVPSRPIDVWLPPGYDATQNTRYPVIYLHDGQFNFDRPSSPYANTWSRLKYWVFGGTFWDVDRAMTRLIASKEIKPAIIISIWNLPKVQRSEEYMPQKPVTEDVDKFLQTSDSDITPNSITSDNYLRFLVTEVKPFIDATYPTQSDRQNTLLMGSSMGGMVSAYAIAEYPDIFGGAACLSTHWNIGGGALINWYNDHWPTAGQHRLYFDYGTKSLDAGYEPYQKHVDQILKDKGYRLGEDWITRRFDGANHSPKAWRDRVHIPLTFLLAR